MNILIFNFLNKFVYIKTSTVVCACIALNIKTAFVGHIQLYKPVLISYF